MAWTEPKTWVTGDPLIASDYNTHIRDNLNALREQTQDVQPKVNALYPAVYQGARLFKAVIGVPSRVSVTSTSLTPWHTNVKLTFTPQTDEVLVRVQLVVGITARVPEVVRFGLRKGNSDISVTDTATTTGDAGTTSDLVFYGFRDREAVALASYEMFVDVTRDAEVTITPTVRVTDTGRTVFLRETSRVLITALDVGVYG